MLENLGTSVHFCIEIISIQDTGNQFEGGSDWFGFQLVCDGEVGGNTDEELLLRGTEGDGEDLAESPFDAIHDGGAGVDHVGFGFVDIITAEVPVEEGEVGAGVGEEAVVVEGDFLVVDRERGERGEFGHLPAVEGPADVGGVGVDDAFGDFGGEPVGDVDADFEGAFFVGAEDAGVEVEEGVDGTLEGFGFGDGAVLDGPAGEFGGDEGAEVGGDHIFSLFVFAEELDENGGGEDEEDEGEDDEEAFGHSLGGGGAGVCDGCLVAVSGG